MCEESNPCIGIGVTNDYYRHYLKYHVKFYSDNEEIPYKTLENKYFSTFKINDFKCELCNKYYKTRKSLYNHYTDVHSKSNVKCHICHQYFRNIQEKKKHLKEEHRINCKYCDLTLGSIFSLKQHIKRMHTNNEKNNKITKKSVRNTNRYQFTLPYQDSFDIHELIGAFIESRNYNPEVLL